MASSQTAHLGRWLAAQAGALESLAFVLQSRADRADALLSGIDVAAKGRACEGRCNPGTRQEGDRAGRGCPRPGARCAISSAPLGTDVGQPGW